MHPAFSTAFSFSCRLNHRLLYPSFFRERGARLPCTLARRSAPLRAVLRRKKQGSQKDARRRGALWLINTRRLVRGRTVTHVHGVGRSLSLSFPFSVSVPLCRPSLRTPSPLSQPIPLFYPSVPFLVSQPRSLFLPSLSPPTPHPHPPPHSPLPPSRARRYARLSRDSPSSSVLLSPAASLFSCYLFVFRALDFSPASFTAPAPLVPLDFSSLLCLSLLSFFRSSTTTNFSLLTPFSRAARSIYLSPFRLSLSLYVPPPPFS